MTTPHAPAPTTSGGMDELGVLSPVGFWDPFNYATSPEQFRRYREVEIKHGRVAMAATLGYIVAETGLRWPAALTLDGSVSFSDIPNGIAAIPAIPGLGWVQVGLARSLPCTRARARDCACVHHTASHLRPPARLPAPAPLLLALTHRTIAIAID